MSENKDKKNHVGDNSPKVPNIPQQEISQASFPQNLQTRRVQSVAIQGSGIPPEAFIYTLPHLDSKDREKFIEIIDKENQRVYNFNLKKSYLNFIISVMSIVIGIGLIIFFTLLNKENLIFEIIKIVGYLLGGSGITFIILKKK